MAFIFRYCMYFDFKQILDGRKRSVYTSMQKYFHSPPNKNPFMEQHVKQKHNMTCQYKMPLFKSIKVIRFFDPLNFER